MERWLGRLADPFYAALRLVAGAMFACHGAQKLFGVLGGQRMTGSPMMLAAGLIELVGGALIALGLMAGLAAFLSSGEMAVGYFTAHAPHGFWPIQNHGELAVLYCFVFLYVAARGSGPISLDASLGRGGRRRR
jgi:putative oxidoreductase